MSITTHLSGHTHRLLVLARGAALLILAAALVGQGVGTAAAGGLDALPAAPPPPGGDGVGAITGAMISLAQTVMTILMVGASILLTIGIATGALQGLFATTVGSPYALAGSWFKIISIVILAVIAFTAPIISKAVIGTVAEFASGGGIPIFGG